MSEPEVFARPTPNRTSAMFMDKYKAFFSNLCPGNKNALRTSLRKFLAGRAKNWYLNNVQGKQVAKDFCATESLFLQWVTKIQQGREEEEYDRRKQGEQESVQAYTDAMTT